MPISPKRLLFVGGLLVTSFLLGCGGSTTPPVERPMEEVEAELAPAEGAN